MKIAHLICSALVSSISVSIYADTFSLESKSSTAERSSELSLTTFLDSAKIGDLRAVESWLQQVGEDRIDETDGSGKTALFYATIGGWFDIVKYLVKKGADTTKKDLKKYTPYRYAVEKGYLEIASYLEGMELLPKDERKKFEPLSEKEKESLFKKAILDRSPSFGGIFEYLYFDLPVREKRSLFEKAIESGHTVAVKTFLSYDKDTVCESGFIRDVKEDEYFSHSYTITPPLALAVRSGHARVVKALLEKSCHIYRPEYRYEEFKGRSVVLSTPFEIALKAKRMDLVKLFVLHGVKLQVESLHEADKLLSTPELKSLGILVEITGHKPSLLERD